MKVPFFLLACVLLAIGCSGNAFEETSDEQTMRKSTPKKFLRENLVAWCIVPFDAKQRGPEARARMLADVGLRRCAYDWRKQHVPTFEQEILAYQKHGIEYTAFWGEHPAAFELFSKYGLTPGLWKMLDQPDAAD